MHEKPELILRLTFTFSVPTKMSIISLAIENETYDILSIMAKHRVAV